MDKISLKRRNFAKASLLTLAGLSVGRVGAASNQAQQKPDSEAGAGMAQRRDAEDAIVALVDFCLATTYNDLPEQVVEVTKLQVLDTVGISLAGFSAEGIPALCSFAARMGGKAESLIWGTNVRIPAHEAVRINGAMSHALDYDDTHEKSYMHPSVITIPAVLALAEKVPGITGKDVIVATALGTDLSCRLAMAGQPGVTPIKIGWDYTTMYGYISSALVAGKLLGLTREQMISAAGIAYHQTAGNAQAHVDGALANRMGPGLAGSAGVLAAMLAKEGLTGARHVLEGPMGLYPLYHRGNYDRSILLGNLGSEFATTDMSFKPYPSCRGGHTAVDAALAIAQKHRFAIGDIKSIEIHTGPDEFRLLGDPIERKRRPQNVVDAQFSGPWVVATALANGGISLADLAPEGISRPEVLQLCEKTVAILDETLVVDGGGVGPARVVVELSDGRRLTETAHTPKGAPNRPMSPAEFEGKFMDCVNVAGFDPARAQTLMKSIYSLETLADASVLPTMMSRAG